MSIDIQMAVCEIVWILVFITLVRFCAASYEFEHHSPAIFTFGDSLLDAGNTNVIVPEPYGITIGSSTGRLSDGLLVIDIISKELGMGLAIPSRAAFNSTTFKSLDFAYGGAQALPQSAQPISDFPTQISQFLAYKQSVVAKNPLQEAEFGKSVYVIEFGTNDIIGRLLRNMSFELIKMNAVPKILEGLKAGIIDLYKNGSTHFFIVNIPGIGCSPFILADFQKTQGLRFDRFGCLQDVNEVVSALNEGMEAVVVQLRYEFPQGKFILFDFYKTKFSILKNSHKLGFKFTTQAACCGSGGAYNCGRGGIVCGCGDGVSLACHNPNEYISWDGLHYTQKFYSEIAKAILKGRYLDLFYSLS